MTEAEWLACTDPMPMLVFLREASDRKLRLFACACCRCIWSLLNEDEHHAVEVAERFSDEFGTNKGRDAARWSRDAARWTGSFARSGRLPAPSRAAAAATFASGWSAACNVAAHSAATGLDGQTQCALLREIFGNPFRPVNLSPSILAWNDDTVNRLAQAAYEERHLTEGTLDNGPLAILADALEEAGCTDADILDHLRGPGPHVRGCWRVDLCLGKS